MKVSFLASALIFLFSFSLLRSLNAQPSLVQVKEGFRSIEVISSVPYPSDVEGQTQRKALSREAALTQGQSALLNHVLLKKTKSKKTLAEVEVPSLDLQRNIRGTVTGAEVIETSWTDQGCTVVMRLPKKKIKEFLRNN